MTYEISKFGNGVLTGSGGNVVENVHTRFNTQKIGGGAGVNKIEGMKEELIIDFTGEMFADEADGLKPFVLPKGAIITDVFAYVDEAFVATGTTPALEVGTDGSEATNGFTIAEAKLEAVGAYNLTSELSGTWDAEAPLAANTKIGFALSGTTPALTRAGKMRISIFFVRTDVAPSPAAA
jgi:hypothetical protein